MRGAPPAGTTLCRLDEIGEPGAKGFAFWSGELMFRGFVVRHGGQVLGYVDRCPHVGTPLTFGDDRYLTRGGDHILCVSHGALFRPEDGLCLGGPCVGRSLTPWPIELVEGSLVTA